jgi:putative DNA-invertase from lambdoid prophage Rac
LGIDLAQVIAALLIELGDLYLASSAGKLVLSTRSAVAEMERDLLVERTNSCLARARAEGKPLGRLPETYTTDIFETKMRPSLPIPLR